MLLRTLGGLRLEGSRLARPKPLLLLTYLSVEGPQHRRHLSELFWPRAASPLSSLRTALAQLRRAAPGAVEADGQRLRAAVPSDVQALLANADAEREDVPYPGPFLDGFHLPDLGEELEEWVYATRELVAETVRSRLLARAEELSGGGSVARAAELAETAYLLPGAPPPTPETIERTHGLLAAAGSPRAAALRREAEGYGIVLGSVAAAPRGRPATPAPPTNLRPRLTSFVGRDLELVDLARLLADDGTRLVTLVGPGGAGKSSLAWAAASQELRSGNFAGGVYVASLEGAPLGAVAPAVGAAVGAEATETVAQLAEVLAGRRVLLVLDGCERHVGRLGELAELLRSCPGLTVLATSRERLGLAGEQSFPVDGLTLPGAGDEASRARYLDSLRLFAQRAKRVDIAFALDQETLPHAAAICRAVAGSPLGIELAAALVRVLPPAEIAAELSRSLDLLSTADAGVPDRHRSLRAAFDHSWELLGPRERGALAALSAFAGGFTRAAASRVAEVTVPVLAALVDKSLVNVLPGGRYQTHPLVRLYALEHLARDGRREDAVRRELAAYLVDLAREAGDGGGGSERLENEAENLRAALSHALEAGDAATALRLASAAWLAWHARGRWREARDWLERSVAAWDAVAPGAPADTDLDAALAEALFGIGVLAAAQGDLAEARSSTERSLAVSERRGDRERVGTALNHLGVIALNEGRYDVAEARLREALAVRRELGDERRAAATLNNLGALAGRQGDMASARRCYEESLAAFRELGDTSAVAILLANLGDVAEYGGDLDLAEARYRESLELHRGLGNEPYVAAALVRLAAVARRRGDLEAARARCLEALATLRDLGNRAGVAECLDELAMVLAHTGRTVESAVVWGAMSALLEKASTPLPPSQRAEHEAAMAAAREASGAAAFERAWRRGRGLRLEEAVGFAFEAAGAAPAARGR